MHFVCCCLHWCECWMQNLRSSTTKVLYYCLVFLAVNSFYFFQHRKCIQTKKRSAQWGHAAFLSEIFHLFQPIFLIQMVFQLSPTHFYFQLESLFKLSNTHNRLICFTLIQTLESNTGQILQVAEELSNCHKSTNGNWKGATFRTASSYNAKPAMQFSSQLMQHFACFSYFPLFKLFIFLPTLSHAIFSLYLLIRTFSENFTETISFIDNRHYSTCKTSNSVSRELFNKPWNIPHLSHFIAIIKEQPFNVQHSHCIFFRNGLSWPLSMDGTEKNQTGFQRECRHITTMNKHNNPLQYILHHMFVSITSYPRSCANLSLHRWRNSTLPAGNSLLTLYDSLKGNIHVQNRSLT